MGKKIKLDEGKVIDMYLNKKMSSYKIADFFSCDGNIILNILRKNKIKLFPAGFFNRGIPSPRRKVLDRKEIKRLYLDERKSSYEISEIMNCSDVHIINYLKKMEIPRRNSSECRIGVKHKNPYTDDQRKARSERVKNEYKKYPHLRILRSKQFKKNAIDSKENGTFEKIREKQRITLKEGYSSGRIKSWNKNLTKETDKRVMVYAEKKIGIKRPDLTEKNNTAEYQRKCRKYSRPNKPEKILKGIIEKNNLPFNYVGDGKIWFKGKGTSFNPDFLSKNPKHIIEMFGDYWHNLPGAKKRDIERLKTYKKYGYKTLVIWEHELKNKGEIVSRINNFLGGNYEKQ